MATISKIKKENDAVSEALKSNCANKKKVLLQKSFKDIVINDLKGRLLRET